MSLVQLDTDMNIGEESGSDRSMTVWVTRKYSFTFYSLFLIII